MIFSAVILGLAGLSFQIARRTTKATDEALQTALLMSGVDRATITEFDSLGTMTPDTVKSGVVTVVVSYTVDSVTYSRKDVRVITATSIPGTTPDTIIIRRARPSPIPLK